MDFQSKVQFPPQINYFSWGGHQQQYGGGTENMHEYKPIENIHPSIFYTRLIRQSGRRGAGAYPSGHRARGRVHPGQVASPSQGHTETNETQPHTRTHSFLGTILKSN